MIDSFPHGFRVLKGLADWRECPDCSDEMESLKHEDRFAWNGFIDLIEDAESDEGIKEDVTRLRCPLPFAPTKAFQPPWMGEFKKLGHNGKKNWRLYFGEPTNRPDMVVGISVWHKLTAWDDAKTQVHERDAITAAMGRLKWYFKQQGYNWSQFPTP